MFDQIIEDIGQDYMPIIRPRTQKLLIRTLKHYKPSRVLEIGTGVGYSGCVILKTLPKATLTTIEIDESRARAAHKYFIEYGYIQRAELIIGDALEVLQTLDGTYDFVFLDGAKGQYYKYLSDITRLLNPKGVIFADDINLMGYVLAPDNVAIPHKHRSSVMNLRKYLQQVNTSPYSSKIYKSEDGVCITRLNKRG